MKRIALALVSIFIFLGAFAQDYSFMTELPDDFSFLDTVPQKQKFFNEHLLGVQYSVDICNVRSSPSVKQSSILTYKNLSVLYTFYHVLWDKMANFGLQTGVKYGSEGYASEYYPTYGEICTYAEIPLVSQFHLNFSRFRFLINVGGYWGYRLTTDKEGGFDQYDQRYKYGILAGGGFAMVFYPIEIHLEGNYKFSLASMYHTNKYSDLYWMYTYPSNIMISAGVFFHLEKKRK